MTTRQTGIWFSGFALVLALAYDFGFYEQGLGANFLVFMTLATLGFGVLVKNTKALQNSFAWWLAVPTLALATAPALYNNEFALYAAPILSGLSWLVLSMILTIKSAGLPLYLSQLALWSHFDGLITNWKHVYSDIFHQEQGSARKIVWGIIIAFPILLIFAGLLASADPIFADWLKNLNIWESIWRFFRTLMFTLFVAGFFYLLVSDKNTLREKTQRVFKLDAITVSVVLGLVNALFALFVYIQIKYLFGGTTFVLGNGITIAEYARSGFFELVRVLVLAAVLIIGTHRSFAHHGSHWIVNSLQALFIAQIGVVAASALYRMGIYQDTYGFTTLRLYVEWFIYAVMGALTFSGIALVAKLEFRRFFQIMLSAMMVVASVVSMINVDAVIARENISRFKAGKGLDMNYISQLSRDAAPELPVLFDQPTLEKLNVSQTLVLKDLITRYKQENASTTLFATDWSKMRSEKALATVPENLTSAFSAAEAKDKKYIETSNAVNLAIPQYVTCLDLPNENKGEFNDLNMPFIPKLGCAQIGDTATTVIQAQLIQKNQRPLKPGDVNSRGIIYSGEQNGDTYYRIVEFNKGTNETTVVFEQELYKGPTQMLDVDQISNFQVHRDGSVIETHFGKREIYRYKLLFEKGRYELAPKQNYSL